MFNKDISAPEVWQVYISILKEKFIIFLLLYDKYVLL